MKKLPKPDRDHKPIPPRKSAVEPESHFAELNGQRLCFRAFTDPRKFLEARKRILGWDECCGLTGEKLRPENGIYLVISNQTGLPNRIVSKARTDQLGFQAAAERLWEGYQAAIVAWQLHEHWYRTGDHQFRTD